VSLYNHAYTHYTPNDAARLDRIYATNDIWKQKKGVETLVAAFTNHLAVLLRVPCFPSIVHWWELYVKRKVKILFTSEGTERNSDRTRLEDFYYSAIYDVIQEPIPHTQKMTTLKKLKSKLI